MAAPVRHITPTLPTHVPVMIGAAEELVTHRELRQKYFTNRSIKTWACWFLLKALTTSGKIQAWRKQLSTLLPYLQLNEKTLYARLRELENLQLLSIDDNGAINLVSYERAAELLGIEYTGLLKIEYNPDAHEGNQVFQYFLRAEEFRYQQQRQLDGLLYHLDKNPSLKNNLVALMVRQGADAQRLYREPAYFQERLLQLQLRLFKEGSELLGYVMERRADINRGVATIKSHHEYKCRTSVSYLKKRMWKLRIIDVQKVCVVSEARSRLYVPVATDSAAGRRERDGYKWIPSKKATALFLTDQIHFLYEVQGRKRGENKAAKAA